MPISRSAPKTAPFPSSSTRSSTQPTPISQQPKQPKKTGVLLENFVLRIENGFHFCQFSKLDLSETRMFSHRPTPWLQLRCTLHSSLKFSPHHLQSSHKRLVRFLISNKFLKNEPSDEKLALNFDEINRIGAIMERYYFDVRRKVRKLIFLKNDYLETT